MIPSVKLKPYISQIRGIAYKPDEIADAPFENSVPLLKANNITDEGLDDSSLIYIDSNRIKPEQFIRAGDLLLAASSGSKKAIGKSAYFTESFGGSFGAFCKVVRPKNGLCPDYLKHFFRTNYYRASIEQAVQGANINNLRNEHLDDLEIPLPIVDNQIRIAHLLGKVEGLIAQRKQHLQQLDDLLKSVFLEMFGDPVRNEKGWDKPPLKAFGKISTGNTPPRNDSSNYDGRHIEWIKTDNIATDSVFVGTATEYLSEAGAQRGRTVSKGALLVACIAGSVESIGRAALTDRTVAFNQQINAIQPAADVNPLFLYGLFKLSRAYIQSHATKGMKKSLTKCDFEQIPMIKPPIDSQNQFAVLVEKFDNLKSRYQQSLADLDALYGALSQQAFKGELDLSRVPLPIVPIEGEQNVVADSLPIQATEAAIHLPETDLIPPALASREHLKELLHEWLEAYRGQSGAAILSIDRFMDAVQARLAELHPDNDFELGQDGYDHIKTWVFDALGSGQLMQVYDDAGNRIQFKAAQA